MQLSMANLTVATPNSYRPAKDELHRFSIFYIFKILKNVPNKSLLFSFFDFPMGPPTSPIGLDAPQGPRGALGPGP